VEEYKRREGMTVEPREEEDKRMEDLEKQLAPRSLTKGAPQSRTTPRVRYRFNTQI